MDGEVNLEVNSAKTSAHVDAIAQNAHVATVTETSHINSKIYTQEDLYRIAITQRLKDIRKDGELIHKKTGNIYYYQGLSINATNSADNEIMVMYSNSNGLTFCREIKEFLDKFTLI